MPKRDRRRPTDSRVLLGVLLAAELLFITLGIWGLAESRVLQTVVGVAGALITAAIVVRLTARSRERSAQEVQAHLRLIRALRPYVIVLCAIFGAGMIAAAVVSSPWWLVGVTPAAAIPLANRAQIKRYSRLSQTTSSSH